ncbi:response regulator [Vibrio methylphosphonaticus]|uniref:response regulator n=1 Tax=Vibrio methylphosphonaticus TaxID=2946866 RepID=UPI00202A70AA|nr:response regulator [Vibrio methylphosphonaticus]MCL9773412.1 response regulator [Vibrio methylphosphonaticus]
MFKLHRKQKFKRLQNTLMLAFLALSITPLTVISLFFLNAHSQDLRDQSTTHLVSVRDTKKQQVLDYFDAQKSEVMGFVRSELAYASGGRFYGIVNAFQRLGDDIEQAQQHAQERYIRGSGDQVKTSIMPDSSSYVGSERYRLLHKRYHRAFVEHLKRSDFDDIVLVDLTGNVTYSVFKHDYYGTNLNTGRFSSTILGSTFAALDQEVTRKHKDNEEYTPVIISDFSSQGEQQYAWLGAPIIQQGYLHSYALFRLPIKGITKLLNSGSAADISLLLVGNDGKAKMMGLSEESITQSKQVIQKALSGETQVGSYSNTLNNQYLAAFAPVQFSGTTWALVAETPESVAFASIRQLEKLFVIAMLSAIILVVIASHYLSNFITSPLLKLTWAAERASGGDLEPSIISANRKDEIGRLALSFERMRRSIKDKIELIKNQNQELEQNLIVIKKQNEELQLANKLKDEFLATTSHELRTPLHGMIGIAEAMISGANGPIGANHRYQLDIIVNSGQRLASLVDDLLDYHKMRYGSLAIERSAVSLTSATQLVLDLSQHLLGNKKIRIINQVLEPIPYVSADPQRLEQVLYNLVGNAIKYTNEGKIVLSATAMDDHIRVQVVDTGHGIPAQQLEHIFEPLVQAGHDSGHYRQGAGLGLSISRQLIELMGGSLYVSSQPHVGTTFSFTLPLASQKEVEAMSYVPQSNHYQVTEQNELAIDDEETLPDNPDGPRILIADDEPVNLRILESFLRLEGYQVTLAKDGLEAMATIEKDKPDLLLLDIMMPGMSGFEVCETLREQYDHAALPIIMLTALNQSEDRVRGFEVGANDYLSKPFNKQELAARIAAHLQASKAEVRRTENQSLKYELKQRALVEASLLETQGRLIEQLDTAPEAILCVRNDLKIQFANQAAAALFKRNVEQLKRSSLDDIIAPKFINLSQEHYCGDIDIFIDDVRQRINADILTLPEGSGLRSVYIFEQGKNTNVSRVKNLETAIDALSSYAIEGDKAKLQELKELGGEFTRLADKASDEQKSRPELMREILVEAMTNSLTYWEDVTGQSKFVFAEQSGLWRVYLDRSTLQTRTLDKYLRVETLPKTPRWRTVLSSMEYILEHCHKQGPERDHIIACRDRLQKLLTS